jgi:copper(I)-binding protein
MLARSLLVWLSLVAIHALAAQPQVEVRNAWARATAPGQQVAGVYFEIVSATDAQLVGLQSPVAVRGELHAMSLENGTMRMRPVEAVALPAGQRVELKPGGLHAMLFELKGPLKPGANLPISIELIDSGGLNHKIPAVVQVRNLDGSEPHHHH